MFFRHHRSTLEGSMETKVYTLPTREAIASYLDVDKTKIEVKKYGYDSRNKWDTYLVTLDGQAIGMTDGPVEDKVERCNQCGEYPLLRNSDFGDKFSDRMECFCGNLATPADTEVKAIQMWNEQQISGLSGKEVRERGGL